MRTPLIALAVLVAVALATPSTSNASWDCTPQRATKATVAKIAQAPRRWMGRCVTITAVRQGNWIYQNVDGLYRLEPDGLDPSSNGLKLGLDDQRDGQEWPPAAFREVTVTGRVQDCETMRDAVHGSAEDSAFVMVRGYCHSYNGTYLWVDELVEGRFKPFKRKIVRGRADDGDLTPAPADWPHRAFIEETAATFLTTLRARDRAALGRLLTVDPDNQPAESQNAEIRFLLDTASSPFVDLPAEGSLQSQILIERYVDDDGSIASEDSDYRSRVCFCRQKTCTGRWPIATFDADNLPARPYACIQINPYLVFRKGTKTQVSVPVEQTGLVEPVG